MTHQPKIWLCIKTNIRKGQGNCRTINGQVLKQFTNLFKIIFPLALKIFNPNLHHHHQIFQNGREMFEMFYNIERVRGKLSGTKQPITGYKMQIGEKI